MNVLERIAPEHFPRTFDISCGCAVELGDSVASPEKVKLDVYQVCWKLAREDNR